MRKLLKKIDNLLLPKMGIYRYLSYVWLLYLAIFVVSLINYRAGEYPILQSALGTVLFLVFYFHGYWAKGTRVWIDILAIALIGTYLTNITPGASVFFVYAGAFCCRLGTPKKALLGLLTLCVWIGAISWIFNYSGYFYVPAILFMLLIGGINIFQFEMDKKRLELDLSQQEIRVLAKTAERERIARDLHDLIGHTFSVITLKAELAGKLLDKDVARAKQEIEQLASISRDALSQIREVVSGYRTSDLTTELAHAKYTLESNDIHFAYSLDAPSISESVNKELAIIVKELVTNVLKHAQASQVDLKIVQQGSRVHLNFIDNGIGLTTHLKSQLNSNLRSESNSSFGVIGIQERVAKLKGDVNFSSNPSLQCNISIPVETSE